MLKKVKDVVMTVGQKIANASKNLFNICMKRLRGKQSNSSVVSHQSSSKAIEGEYLGKGGLIVAGSLAFAGNALAAVPEAVTTAITTAATDVTTIGTAILGVVVVIAAFFWMRRPIK